MEPAKQKITSSKIPNEISSDINIQNQALEKIAKGLKAKSQKKEPDVPQKGKK